MTSLACPVGRTRSLRAVPPPIRDLFRAAGLEPPRAVDELDVHSEERQGVRKTLLRLTTSAGALHDFVAGFRHADGWCCRAPGPAGTPSAAARPPDRSRAVGGGGERMMEVQDDDAPWWRARAGATIQRATYDTPGLDFVELVVCEAAGEILLRTIGGDH